MKESASLIENIRVNGALMQGIFSVTDGGRMPLADYADTNMKNAYLEGFTQRVEVKNLFVYNFFARSLFTPRKIILVDGMILSWKLFLGSNFRNNQMSSLQRAWAYSETVNVSTTSG